MKGLRFLHNALLLTDICFRQIKNAILWNGNNSENTCDRATILAFTQPLIALYQSIKFHMIPFNTYTDMLRTSSTASRVIYAHSPILEKVLYEFLKALLNRGKIGLKWTKNLNKNSGECYVAPALRLYIKSRVKASVWHIFGQNPFGSS